MLKMECKHGWPHLTANNPWAFIKYQHVILAFMIRHVFLEMFGLIFFTAFSILVAFSFSCEFQVAQPEICFFYLFHWANCHITVQQQVTILNVTSNSSNFI